MNAFHEKLRELAADIAPGSPYMIIEAADKIEELAAEVADLRNQNHCNRVAAEARWDRIRKLETENDALRVDLLLRTKAKKDKP